jgi:membrane-associated phospholipid phosphatase
LIPANLAETILQLKETNVTAAARKAGCATGFLLLAALAVAARQPAGSWLDKLDRPAADLVAARRGPREIRAARAVSALAEPAVAAIVLTAGTIAAIRRADWKASWAPPLVVLSGVAFRRVLSKAIGRPRPPAANWLIQPEGFSLPSKHTALAALTAGACAWAFGANRACCHTAAWAAGTTVGASRICLGVHWPSDVLAGWLFAAGWLDLAELAATLVSSPVDSTRRSAAALEPEVSG